MADNSGRTVGHHGKLPAQGLGVNSADVPASPHLQVPSEVVAPVPVFHDGSELPLAHALVLVMRKKWALSVVAVAKSPKA